MADKLPRKVREVIDEIQSVQVPHLVYVINALNRNDQSLPTHLSEKPVDYYRGMLDGAYITIERLLLAYGAYKGFRWVTEIHHQYHV